MFLEKVKINDDNKMNSIEVFDLLSILGAVYSTNDEIQNEIENDIKNENENKNEKKIIDDDNESLCFDDDNEMKDLYGSNDTRSLFDFHNDIIYPDKNEIKKLTNEVGKIVKKERKITHEKKLNELSEEMIANKSGATDQKNDKKKWKEEEDLSQIDLVSEKKKLKEEENEIKKIQLKLFLMQKNHTDHQLQQKQQQQKQQKQQKQKLLQQQEQNKLNLKRISTSKSQIQKNVLIEPKNGNYSKTETEIEIDEKYSVKNGIKSTPVKNLRSRIPVPSPRGGHDKQNSNYNILNDTNINNINNDNKRNGSNDRQIGKVIHNNNNDNDNNDNIKNNIKNNSNKNGTNYNSNNDEKNSNNNNGNKNDVNNDNTNGDNADDNHINDDIYDSANELLDPYDDQYEYYNGNDNNNNGNNESNSNNDNNNYLKNSNINDFQTSNSPSFDDVPLVDHIQVRANVYWIKFNYIIQFKFRLNSSGLLIKLFFLFTIIILFVFPFIFLTNTSIDTLLI